MKKEGLLHPELNKLIASSGHTDEIVVTDAGLPIPPDLPYHIDFALKEGQLAFLDVLDGVTESFSVEKIILAEEIKQASPEMEKQILERFPGVETTYIPHDSFKKRTQSAMGTVRSGEFTPYANVILCGGVVY
ncbi:D-ribose pyranase [Alkalicoccus urumqiensis]|uniref:D-ribose pyranase n=1 Tax=Alkalicoccus urumqiensis TaxID=1548213 RepID=A0A2P6ML98_ALKUR|nr:D-ribose pyranase [Alkalicoccus urumqiensis]PRO67043.1 D-ribose pyranase [Alkalicoccus urumqiensis]